MVYRIFSMEEKAWVRLYTDDQYLTKAEVQMAMRTSLIDDYWNDITAYRKKYAHPFSFRTITNHHYGLTYDETIKARIGVVEAKLGKLVSLIKKLVDPKQEEAGERLALLACLKPMNMMENAQMSELSLKALLNGTYAENNPFHKPVIDYASALKSYAEGKDNAEVSDEFLGVALAKCLGESELTSFYRSFDFDASAERARYMLNPDYNYAPNGLIESLMGDFLSYLSTTDDPILVQAVATLYYFDYVKPFEKANGEVACLLAKGIYSSGEMGKEAFYLPLEALGIKTPKWRSYALEAQRSGDLTYLLLYCLSLLDPILDSLFEAIANLKIETYRPEYTTLSPEEKAVAAPKETVQMSLFENPEEKPSSPAPKAEAPAPSPKPAPVFVAPKETPTPLKEAAPVIAPAIAPAPAPTPKTAPKKEIPHLDALPTEEENADRGAISLSRPSEGLSEKEVKEYIQYLLETNPSLNKNQASFLANHCTVGRYYTIQQFKKFTRCAYETARTSMDKLSEEKYYEKKQVKNKFVYTPLRKGEEK